MDPQFMAQINQLADAFYNAYGQPLRITSGYRPTWRQAQIYNSGVRPAAPPGRSSHERGAAIDIDRSQVPLVNRLPLQQMGLETLARINDPIHIQRMTAMADKRGAGKPHGYWIVEEDEPQAAPKPEQKKGVPVPADFGQTPWAQKYPEFGKDKVAEMAAAIRNAPRTSPLGAVPSFLARPLASAIDYVGDSPRLQKVLGAVGSAIDLPHQALSKPAGELLAKVLPEEMMMSPLGESGEVGGPEKFEAKRFAKEAVPLMLDFPVYAGAGNVLKEGGHLVKGGANVLRRAASPAIELNAAPGFFARQAPHLRETAPLPTATLAEPATTAGAEAASVAKGDALADALNDVKSNLGTAAEAATATPTAAGPAQTLGGPGGWRPWSPPSELDIAAQKMQEQIGIIGRRGFPPQLRQKFGGAETLSPEEVRAMHARGYGFSPPSRMQHPERVWERFDISRPDVPVRTSPEMHRPRIKYGDEAAIDAEWRARQAGGYGAGPIGKGQMRKVVFPPSGVPRPPIDFEKVKKIEQSIGLNIRGIDPGVNQNLRLIDTLSKYGGEPTIESVIEKDPGTILWKIMRERGGG